MTEKEQERVEEIQHACDEAKKSLDEAAGDLECGVSCEALTDAEMNLAHAIENITEALRVLKEVR